MRKLRKTIKWSALTMIGLLSILIVWTLGRDAWISRTRVDCPILVWLRPLPNHSVTPSDSLTLTYSSGWGRIGTIQVYGDGKVERDTTLTSPDGEIFGCPLHEEDKHLHIESKTASAIINKAQNEGFFRLCAIYRYPGIIFDAGTQELTLKVAGTSHSVRNHAGTPPALFEGLEGAIWSAIPPMPGYATGRTQSAADEARCKAFERQQEVVNQRIEKRSSQP